MEPIRSATYKRMPWKNGGGETTEIVVSPPGADLASMEWRLSMAIVACDGPFSVFPGIDRTLSVLHGALDLEIEGARVGLDETSAPHFFAGDAKVEGSVVRGPVTDLNVMTRRERFTHEVNRLHLSDTQTIRSFAGTLAVFCDVGCVVLSPGRGSPTFAPLPLGPRDTAVGSAPSGGLLLSPQSPSTVYVIAIQPR
jgi:environmental stress-induced protein Ves